MKWKIDNPEKLAESIKKDNARPEKKRQLYLSAKRRRKNGEYRRWQRSNPDKIRKYNLNRANKNHDISEEEWSACKEYFNNSCAYCGITEHNAIERFNNRLHKEHVVHDGSNRLDNCVPACKECNSSKHTSDFEVWYRETTFYTEERFNMIVRWLENDHKKYLKN